MPEFVPILVIAILVFAALLVTFGNVVVTPRPTTPTTPGAGEAPLIEKFTLSEDFVVSGAAGEKEVTSISGTVSKGLISGIDKSLSFEIPSFASVSSGKIKLNVINTNNYGPLLIDLNGNNIYDSYPRTGKHVIDFEKDVLKQFTTIEIKAGSSGWRFWAPTIYKFGADVYVEYYGKLIEEMDFEIDEEAFDDDTYAELSVDIGNIDGTGRLIVKVNGFEVWRGSKDDTIKLANEVLQEERNMVEVSSEADARYEVKSVEVEVFY